MKKYLVLAALVATVGCVNAETTEEATEQVLNVEEATGLTAADAKADVLKAVEVVAQQVEETITKALAERDEVVAQGVSSDSSDEV